ncbi:hypothetical protein BCR35DRAFT_309577 [Leucosporidium creatinivorum]|uniref:Uncharacterized protein n=1 Tax=Leucosporidium creatinivorum TaxID=106004 RepID=A0A1Y2DEG9_9BASI|nr:hypothetical protein BCR35DRAFT_309577 [Leucosporidium creatinivorum]
MARASTLSPRPSRGVATTSTSLAPRPSTLFPMEPPPSPPPIAISRTLNATLRPRELPSRRGFGTGSPSPSLRAALNGSSPPSYFQCATPEVSSYTFSLVGESSAASWSLRMPKATSPRAGVRRSRGAVKRPKVLHIRLQGTESNMDKLQGRH